MNESTGLAYLAAVVLLVVLARQAYRAARRATRDRQPEDVLTFIVAALATSGAAQGTFKFFGDKLDMPAWMQATTFAMFELGMLTCALRARRKIRDPKIGAAGVDGALVWVISGVSALLASTDADGPGIIARLILPFFAASMWELLLAVERRRNDRSTIHWRITPERVLVALGLAEATGRTASDVDAHRRLTRLARAVMRLRMLRGGNAWEWRVRLAERRVNRAMMAAIEYANLATDPARQNALMAQLGALHNATALAGLDPAAPWEAPELPPRLRLVRLDEVRPEVGAQVGDDVPGDVPDTYPEQPEQSGGDGPGDEQEPPVDERPDDVPESVPVIDPEELEKLLRTARRKFRRVLASGTTPSIKDLKTSLRIGQDKAKAVQDALTTPGMERGA